MGAISDFLSQGFTELFSGMAEDCFFGLFENKLFKDFFNKTTCADFVNEFIIGDSVLNPILSSKADSKREAICNKSIKITSNPNMFNSFNPENPLNSRFWIENILYKKIELKEFLNLTDLENTLLIREDSIVVKKLAVYANEILKTYNVTNGNYKAFNKLKIAADQWAKGIVTNSTNNTLSVRDWRPDHYKSLHEFFIYCQKFYPDKCNEITTDDIYLIANSEGLFISQYINGLFIDHYNNKNSTNISLEYFLLIT
jgi:hypothetical protein